MLNDIIQEFGETSVNKVQEIFFSLFKTFNKGDYAIIGGIAVKLLSKEKARQLTPDIDIIFNPKVMNKVGKFLVENHFDIIDTGLFVSTKSDNVELDYKFAETKLEFEILNKTISIPYKDVEIFITSIETLITMKLDVLREKDEKDIVLLLKQPFHEETLCNYICKFTPDKHEELEQLKMISQI